MLNKNEEEKTFIRRIGFGSHTPFHSSVILRYTFGCYVPKIALLRNGNEIEPENSADGIVNEEESSNVSSFWGDDAVSDHDDSSASSQSTNDLENVESQSTGQAILAIAIPALAGLAIDPLMVR